MTGTGETARSLWADSALVDEPVSTPFEGTERFDIVVIGAGFTGLSTALHAAENGRHVAVVEAGQVGQGASGRNGGQVNPGLKHDEAALAVRFGDDGRGLYRAGQEAPDFLARLVERHGLQCRWQRNGLFRLAHSRQAMAAIGPAVRSLNAQGIDAEELSADDIAARVGTRRYLGGLFDPRGASVHPLELVRELARAAIDKGVAVHTASPATGLTRKGDDWQVTTPTGILTAPHVVVATNAYTDGLVERLERSVLPVNSFQIATEPLGALAAEILPGGQTVYDSRRLVLYFRRSPDDRLIMGGRASFSSSPSVQKSVADYSVLQGVLHEAFPQSRGLAITHRWTGLVCITMDFLPHHHTPQPGLHVLLGYNGRGVALSVRLGAWLGRKLSGAAEGWSMPSTSIKPIPLHPWRQPILNAGMQWNRILDTLGR